MLPRLDKRMEQLPMVLYNDQLSTASICIDIVATNPAAPTSAAQ
jgi:hypothetical protein